MQQPTICHKFQTKFVVDKSAGDIALARPKQHAKFTIDKKALLSFGGPRRRWVTFLLDSWKQIDVYAYTGRDGHQSVCLITLCRPLRRNATYISSICSAYILFMSHE